MQAENSNERKMLKRRFLSLYLVSLVLMGIVFASLWERNGEKPLNKMNAGIQPLSEEQHLLQADALLHTRFKELQKLEQEYILLLADSGTVKNQKSFSDTLDRFNKRIAGTTERLSLMMDSIARAKSTFTSPSARQGIQTVITSFNEELHYHQLTNSMRSLLSSGSIEPADMAAIAKWQVELQRKDEQVRKLEDQLSKAHQEKNVRIGEMPEVAMVASLRTAQVDAEAREGFLVKTNKALKEDNDRLAGEISRYNRLMESGDVVTKEKQSDLEKKVKELTDDLYLSQVDCNLSRADAKQIVYNSKQRKDLLAEALGVLKNLSLSGNAGVQQKVKEKTAQLQNIANTVRD